MTPWYLLSREEWLAACRRAVEAAKQPRRPPEERPAEEADHV